MTVDVLPFHHKENYTLEEKVCCFTEIVLNIITDI